MSFEFEKLSDVGSLDEFPEGAKVLIEHGGDIKRCAANGLGGGGGYHWIHLDMNIETEEIICDEEITFESLREDTANGIMPVAVIDVSFEGDGGQQSLLAIMPFVMIQDAVGGDYEEHTAMFIGGGYVGVFLSYEDGQYTWIFQGM